MMLIALDEKHASTKTLGIYDMSIWYSPPAPR